MQQVVQSSMHGMSSGLQTTIDERGTAVVMCSTDPANRLEISLAAHNQNLRGKNEVLYQFSKQVRTPHYPMMFQRLTFKRVKTSQNSVLFVLKLDTGGGAHSIAFPWIFIASSRKFFNLFIVALEFTGLLKASNTKSTGCERFPRDVPALAGSMNIAKYARMSCQGSYADNVYVYI